LVGNTNRYATAPSTRRAYSFFSSKPGGGGRYFNSARPSNSKVIAPTKPKTKTESSDAADTVNSSSGVEEGSHGQESYAGATTSSSPAWKPVMPTEQQPFDHIPVTPHDLNLHNFFSLHRPLLLISQPTSTLFETSSSFNIKSASDLASDPPPPVPEAGMGTFEEAPEASPEADVDAARLLSTALFLNRLNSAVSWESTLKKLGLDVNEGREAEQGALMNVYDANMDSTKRKRRRKMKKHKLKKRRRLQRSERIKIGK